jgi:hypothetical protein
LKTILKFLISLTFYIVLGLVFNKGFAQTGVIKGKVLDAENREPIPFANIILQGTSYGAISNMEGKFIIENIPPGTYNIIASFVGYEKQIIYEANIISARTIVLNFEMKSMSSQLSELEISVSRFDKTDESPISKTTIRAAEIIRNPGGNRDISKVLQSFPGVASTVSFRNDIIIRGGAPNENRFYIDGIETPNINHFATQGSSGGPVGMINVNFINEVEFFSGAFPASRGNALSSVLEFNQKNGNPDRIITNVMLGSSDVGLTFDGPVSKNADFIFSIRRSYLQFLFSALKLPFLPTYNDSQFKLNYRLNDKNTITIIGLGAIDEFKLNQNANTGISDSALIERNNYILGYLPVNEQWNYTAGIKYTHYSKNGIQKIIISRNMLNNTSVKFKNNIETEPNNLILNYKSTEAENKLRIENTLFLNKYKLTYGINYEYAQYFNSTYNKLALPGGVFTYNYLTRLNINKGGLFVQGSTRLLDNKIILSAGIRTDFNDYSDAMNNPFEQISPRFSASVKLTEKWFWNFNTGRYFQLPSYTILGFKDSTQTLVNKENSVKYISCLHWVTGLEFLPDQNTKISAEGFVKIYSFYPLLLREGISLANLGSDFGVIGNAPVSSTSNGRSYGMELFVQRTVKKGIYGIMAYTFVRSEFTNADNNYSLSSWDNRHILSLTGGKQFKRNWEAGLKFRLLSGAPYTPYDLNTSALKTSWDITRQGILDYSMINSERLPLAHQMDIRIDKKIYYKKSTLNIYLDIQNIYNKKIFLPSFLTVVNDTGNNPTEDPSNPSRYLLKEILNETGTILPSIGIMFEF